MAGRETGTAPKNTANTQCTHCTVYYYTIQTITRYIIQYIAFQLSPLNFLSSVLSRILETVLRYKRQLYLLQIMSCYEIKFKNKIYVFQTHNKLCIEAVFNSSSSCEVNAKHDYLLAIIGSVGLL